MPTTLLPLASQVVAGPPQGKRISAVGGPGAARPGRRSAAPAPAAITAVLARKAGRAGALALGTMVALTSYAATAAPPAADDDALDLQARPDAAASSATPSAANAAGASAATGTTDLKLFFELAALRAEPQASQGGPGSTDGRRASIDLRWSRKLSDAWRFGLSDRLDDIHPVLTGQRSTRNSLREAYFAWQGDGQFAGAGSAALELGRLNVRHGPAYGYSPTDYFRTGATRTVVSADPVALRENRVGTFMLQGSQQWAGAGVSAAWAPQLTHDAPSSQAFTLDLGATNASHRVLLAANGRASDRWSGEALLLMGQHASPRLGLNLTGLLTDAAVLHAEWSTMRSANLLNTSLGQAGPERRVQQASVGITYALPTGLSLTAEAEYNGAGLSRAGWATLFAQGPVAVARFFGATQASQELASRSALLLYATQKGAFTKQLDLTAFVRHSAVDHSHLAWAEARYHWPRFDLALQAQRSSAGGPTEYGALPYRQVVQLVGYLYF